MNKETKRKISAYALGLGMTFLVLGIAADNTIFTWISVGLVLLSLVLGGRWLRPKKRQ
ncbi:MAG: hypothetical protein HXY38_13545 [Chloroflexi bacterium]|nr:hypothetical protein [Chloroflexota bacterium]